MAIFNNITNNLTLQSGQPESMGKAVAVGQAVLPGMLKSSYSLRYIPVWDSLTSSSICTSCPKAPGQSLPTARIT